MFDNFIEQNNILSDTHVCCHHVIIAGLCCHYALKWMCSSLSYSQCQVLILSQCSYLREHIPAFVCVPSLSVYSVLTSRRVDPLTVIPLPNLRGISEAQSAQY